MNGTVTPSHLAAPVQQYFDKALAAVQVPQLIHKTAAMKRKMPRNSGTTYRIRRPNRLPTSPVPLEPALAPPPTIPTAVDIDAKMSFYGQFIRVAEEVTLQNQDGPANWFAKVLGIAMKQTQDELTRDMLAATAFQLDCIGGFNGDRPTNPTTTDFDDMRVQLVSEDAETILGSLQGENRFGTSPIRDSFFALCHSDLIREFSQNPDFVYKSNYPSERTVLRSEEGQINNFRIMISSVGSITPNASQQGANVYNIFCPGMESYVCVDQEGYEANFLYRPAHIVSTMARVAELGYKFAMVPEIIQDNWLGNLRCTRST